MIRSISRRALVTSLVSLSTPSIALTRRRVVTVADIGAYIADPNFYTPYGRAMAMAVQEINSDGGVRSLDGASIELLAADDGDSVARTRQYFERVRRDRPISIFLGAATDPISHAIANESKNTGTPFLVTGPYTSVINDAEKIGIIRLPPTSRVLAVSLINHAQASRRLKWAIVAARSDFGVSAADQFQSCLSAVAPNARVVIRQHITLGRYEADSVVVELLRTDADAIFCSLDGLGIRAFVERGRARGLFRDRTVFSLSLGDANYRGHEEVDVPEGWIVTGYPWREISSLGHRRFIYEYQRRSSRNPTYGALLGYVAAYIVRDALERAESTDSSTLRAALKDKPFETIVGPISFNGATGLSNMGAWVGETASEAAGTGLRNSTLISKLPCSAR